MSVRVKNPNTKVKGNDKYGINLNYKNCVYMLINPVNNKKYIGKTVNLKERYSQHKYNAKKRKERNPMYEEMDRIGIENFKLVILQYNLSTDEMNYYEQYYINMYDTLYKNGKGYNIGNGGKSENKLAGMTKNARENHSEKLSQHSVNRKKAAKYDNEGCLIKTYDSYMEAEKEICCRIQSLDYTKPSHFGGYYWLTYDDMPLEKITIQKSKLAPINIGRYDEHGFLVKRYPSLNSVKKDGYSKYKVSCVLDTNIMYENYYWKTEEEL